MFPSPTCPSRDRRSNPLGPSLPPLEEGASCRQSVVPRICYHLSFSSFLLPLILQDCNFVNILRIIRLYFSLQNSSPQSSLSERHTNLKSPETITEVVGVWPCQTHAVMRLIQHKPPFICTISLCFWVPVLFSVWPKKETLLKLRS